MYLCQECGNEFTSEREPRFCPYCSGEELIIVAEA